MGNDFGFEQAFARQVTAHGREGDILVLLTTSGRSHNLVHAAQAGREAGLRVWAMTGPVPNPVADLADEVLAVDVPSTTAVQEAQLVAVHAICAALEARLALADPALAGSTSSATRRYGDRYGDRYDDRYDDHYGFAEVG